MNFGLGLPGYDLPRLDFAHDVPAPGTVGYSHEGPNPCRRCGLVGGNTCTTAVVLALYDDVQQVKRDMKSLRDEIRRQR